MRRDCNAIETPSTMSVSEQAFRQLQALGADAFAHVNGSLALHLQGTEALLRRWGNREAVCLGGLYHAVYGTDRITGSLADLGMREAIAAVLGSEAEELAYLYGACARETFHPRNGTPDQLMFADRFAACEYPISASRLRDLCEITMANELDLALANPRFRDKYGADPDMLVAKGPPGFLMSHTCIISGLRVIGTPFPHRPDLSENPMTIRRSRRHTGSIHAW